MKPLRPHTPFDAVIPVLAQTFGDLDELEESVLNALSPAVLDADEWRLVEEAVQMGHLDSDDIDAEFATFLSDELSRASCDELQGLDRAILQAAALDDAGSLWFLGVRLAVAASSSVDKDEQNDLEDDSLLLLAEASEAGEPRAQWMLGERYSRMREGMDESLRVLGKAAAQGFAPASVRLLELFENRRANGNQRTETKWLRKFAQAGLTDAQFELASEQYLRGELADAFAWMVKAAQAGHHAAQQRVAFFYDVGEGCSRNPARADYWRNFDQQSAEPATPTPEEHEAIVEAESIQVEPAADIAPQEVAADLDVETPIEDPEQDTKLEPAFAPSDETSHDTQHERFDDEEGDLDGRDDEEDDDLDEQIDEEDEEGQPFATVDAERDEPISADAENAGLVSRFRSGLAGVLRRLADKVSGSR